MDHVGKTYHASFIVAHHGVVTACQAPELCHLKRNIQTIGKGISSWMESIH